MNSACFFLSAFQVHLSELRQMQFCAFTFKVIFWDSVYCIFRNYRYVKQRSCIWVFRGHQRKHRKINSFRELKPWWRKATTFLTCCGVKLPQRVERRNNYWFLHMFKNQLLFSQAVFFSTCYSVGWSRFGVCTGHHFRGSTRSQERHRSSDR